MRRAAARAASRRGSCTTILRVAEPRRVEQGQRHARRLAGAGRRHQHGGIARLQRLLQPRQGFVDRKGLHRGGL